jgi:hypothetical protein
VERIGVLHNGFLNPQDRWLGYPVAVLAGIGCTFDPTSGTCWRFSGAAGLNGFSVA